MVPRRVREARQRNGSRIVANSNAVVDVRKMYEGAEEQGLGLLNIESPLGMLYPLPVHSDAG